MIEVEMQGRSTLRRAARVYSETVLEKGFRRVGLYSRDLSLGGALIDTRDLDLAIGDEVFLALKAPGTRFWMDTRARVVRLLRGRRHEDLGRLAIGVEFVELDGIYRAVLGAALRFMPPPVPSRPHRTTTRTALVAIAD